MKKIEKETSFPYWAFHELTEIKNHSSSRLRPSTTILQKLNAVSYKEYPRSRPYLLSINSLPTLSLQESLSRRHSGRMFSKKPVSLRTLSSLLYYSAGIKQGGKKRFYPSAGARYPLETYVYSLNTELPYGLYHYNLQKNHLEYISAKKPSLSASLLHQQWVRQAGCIIIITAVFRRTTLKYGDRGYRYILMEAGHLMQNISLVSIALHLDGHIIGGFIDRKINTILGVDGKNEAALCIFAAGHTDR